jgi:hypothetical protein
VTELIDRAMTEWGEAFVAYLKESLSNQISRDRLRKLGYVVGQNTDGTLYAKKKSVAPRGLGLG